MITSFFILFFPSLEKSFPINGIFDRKGIPPLLSYFLSLIRPPIINGLLFIKQNQ